MDTPESANNIQENYKDGNISEEEDRNETYQILPARQSLSSMPERHNEVSPLLRVPSGVFSTPAQNTGLEDIREEDNEDDCVHSAHNPPPCTTFTILPSHTTPPSRQNKVRNPFDAALIKRLHLPTFSPSVFKRVVSPTQDMHQFCWTIDDVARIKPAPIEEYQLQQYEHAVDPETELKAQEAIDHYFCNTHIVSSPWGPQVSNKTSALFVETNDNYSADKRTSLNSSGGDGQEAISGDHNYMSTKKEVSTQTTLTLPPELPSVLEAALKPYFAFTEEQSESAEEANLSISTLRRKLFVHDENHQEIPISSARSSCFSMQVECKFNSPAHSGLLLATSSRIICPSAPVIDDRTYGTPLPGSKLVSSPEISPIGSTTPVHRYKSVTRLNFSSKMMSVDNSATCSPSVSPLGFVQIQHDDDHRFDHKTSDCLLPSSSSAMVTSETSTPVKEVGSLSSTSAMIISEASRPVEEKCLPYNEDVPMESLHFKQVEKKLKEFENTDNFTVEGDLTSLNSFSLNSAVENSVSNYSNMQSHDTGYQTGSMSCNMTSINGGSTSAFSSLASVSKNWDSLHLKSLGHKYVGKSSEGFNTGKCNIGDKGSTVALEDNSLWLPSSKHFVSSTPTKIYD